MRRALAVMFVAAAGTAEASPASTTTLDDADIATLRGCWRVRGQRETWTFRPHGAHELEVVRELGPDAVEAKRARIPHTVMVSTKDHAFAFTAAGRIHGLMLIFNIVGKTLQASWYTSHDGTSYVFTGNNVVAERCTP